MQWINEKIFEWRVCLLSFSLIIFTNIYYLYIMIVCIKVHTLTLVAIRYAGIPWEKASVLALISLSLATPCWSKGVGQFFFLNFGWFLPFVYKTLSNSPINCSIRFALLLMSYWRWYFIGCAFRDLSIYIT